MVSRSDEKSRFSRRVLEQHPQTASASTRQGINIYGKTKNLRFLEAKSSADIETIASASRKDAIVPRTKRDRIGDILGKSGVCFAASYPGTEDSAARSREICGK